MTLSISIEASLSFHIPTTLNSIPTTLLPLKSSTQSLNSTTTPELKRLEGIKRRNDGDGAYPKKNIKRKTLKAEVARWNEQLLIEVLVANPISNKTAVKDWMKILKASYSGRAGSEREHSLEAFDRKVRSILGRTFPYVPSSLSITIPKRRWVQCARPTMSATEAGVNLIILEKILKADERDVTESIAVRHERIRVAYNTQTGSKFEKRQILPYINFLVYPVPSPEVSKISSSSSSGITQISESPIELLSSHQSETSSPEELSCSLVNMIQLADSTGGVDLARLTEQEFRPFS